MRRLLWWSDVRVNRVYYSDIRPLQELPQRFMDRFAGIPAGMKFYVNDSEMKLILDLEALEKQNE